jgi:uncharacterized protein (DUF427 family)
MPSSTTSRPERTHELPSPAVDDYPQHLEPPGRVEPVPRRVRAFVAGTAVLDTTRALYLWEHPAYPAFLIARADVDEALLIDEQRLHKLRLGNARGYGLRVGSYERAGAARLYTESELPQILDHFRFEWDAVEAWFEEDEQVFVHPRNPYVRVDALRSTRRVRVELGGVVLAETASPVMVFETGLPTRYYINRGEVDFTHLEASATTTACPYKGRTTGYWSVRVDGELHKDLAWCYDFPLAAVAPIAGLVAFYNEKLDIRLDGELLERPQTKFA